MRMTDSTSVCRAKQSAAIVSSPREQVTSRPIEVRRGYADVRLLRQGGAALADVTAAARKPRRSATGHSQHQP